MAQFKMMVHQWMSQNKFSQPDEDYKQFLENGQLSFRCKLRSPEFSFIGYGTAHSKKEAKTAAAKDFWRKLEKNGHIRSSRTQIPTPLNETSMSLGSHSPNIRPSMRDSGFDSRSGAYSVRGNGPRSVSKSRNPEPLENPFSRVASSPFNQAAGSRMQSGGRHRSPKKRPWLVNCSPVPLKRRNDWDTPLGKYPRRELPAVGDSGRWSRQSDYQGVNTEPPFINVDHGHDYGDNTGYMGDAQSFGDVDTTDEWASPTDSSSSEKANHSVSKSQCLNNDGRMNFEYFNKGGSYSYKPLNSGSAAGQDMWSPKTPPLKITSVYSIAKHGQLPSSSGNRPTSSVETLQPDPNSYAPIRVATHPKKNPMSMYGGPIINEQEPLPNSSGSGSNAEPTRPKENPLRMFSGPIIAGYND